MKAITLDIAGGAEVLNLVDKPEPQIKPGEVKIRIRAFGINRVECYYRAGNYGTLVPGQTLGIEATGEVVADPGGHFSPGQKVITIVGGMMFERDGSYAEYISVKPEYVLAIDSEIDFIKLAGLPLVYLTAWGALDYTLNIKAGDTLLVRGATSAVGLAMLTYAKACGLTVIATTRKEERRARLQELGADHVIIDDGEIAGAVREIFPEGVDKILEVVGGSTLKDSLKTVKNWGEVVVIGLLAGTPKLDDFHLIGDLPSSVKLSFFSSRSIGAEPLPIGNSTLNWVAEQVHQGKIPEITSGVFNANDIREVHKNMDDNTAFGKMVVHF